LHKPRAYFNIFPSIENQTNVALEDKSMSVWLLTDVALVVNVRQHTDFQGTVTPERFLAWNIYTGSSIAAW